MDCFLKNFKILLLLAVVAGQVGCVSTPDAAYDPSLTPEAVPSHDDAHGWGTAVQASGSH
jgi:photosystem II stability/assembly factor-like uncharacterized protein